ncbi:MAG: ABC transporter permease subunit [Planctomycetota bacterium]
MPVFLRWLLALLPLNPIVVRLVQGGSRRMQHMYIRSAYLAVLIIVLLALLLQVQGGSTEFRKLAANGANAFEIVAYIQIGLICILAPVFMAGAIAQESNPRTWDIMLTTPLSALQLVLGTLFGRLFFVLALLIASLPLFAITQYFGGVPGSAVLLSYAVSATAAILVGAIAVALAVNRLAGRRAVFAFYISVVTYLAITFVIDLRLTTPWNGVTLMTPLNPFLALRALLEPSSYPGPDEVQLRDMGTFARLWFGRPVLAWCLVSGGISMLLVGISTFTVRSIGSRTGVPWYRRMLRLGARGATTRPPRSVSTNPIAWREAFARAATLPKILARWAFVLAGALWGIAIVAVYHTGSLSHAGFRELLIATVWTELVVTTLVAINMSATAVTREREDGTLDLLLTTPITPKEYLGGKLLGLITYLLPLVAVPLGTVAVAAGYVLAGGFGREGGVTTPATFGTAAPAPVPVILPEVGLMLPLVAIPFLAFCVMVGLQWSLKSRGTIGSVVSTVGVVGVITSIVGLCGWQAAQSIPVVGPALAALNPITLLWASVQPDDAFADSVSTLAELPQARFGMAVGAIGATGVYIGIVLGMRSSMTRTFDMTTRRLAGTA